MILNKLLLIELDIVMLLKFFFVIKILVIRLGILVFVVKNVNFMIWKRKEYDCFI